MRCGNNTLIGLFIEPMRKLLALPLSFAILLFILFSATGCVTVAKTTVGTAVKGARVGTKAAVSTVGTAAKAAGSAVSSDQDERTEP